MIDNEDYKKLISEIIHKQIDILGPEIAIRKARNVPGIEMTDSGEVTGLSADPQETAQSLVDEYIALSGEIVKNILGPVFAKYPDIKLSPKIK